MSEVKEEHSGLSVDYYKLDVPDPANLKKAYKCECLDIIRGLNMTFDEGEAFKAIWRKAARRTLGLIKKGSDDIYDAEKIKFYGEGVHKQAISDKLKYIRSKSLSELASESETRIP